MSVLVGKEAPDFMATAIMEDNSIKENFSLKHHLKGHKGMLFFYPLDFTFVCPSEIIAFHKRIEAFKERDTKVVGISVDSHFSHLAWKNTPINKGGIGNIDFPLVSDITKNIARSYDVLIHDSIALRGSFLIDEDFIVRHQVINDLPLGRNIDEALRMIDALEFFQKNGEVCPAGWGKGKKAMKPNAESVALYLSESLDML